jgi:hypothetical protein
MSLTNRDDKFVDEKGSRSLDSGTRTFEQPALANDEGLPIDEDRELTLHRGLKGLSNRLAVLWHN